MTLTWQDYERAVLEHLRQEFAGAAISVFGTAGGVRHTVTGRYSLVSRQLDAAAYGVGDERPFFIADAKMQAESLDVKEIEMFIGMADDVGAKIAAMLAPNGFTAAARRRAEAAAMHLELLTLDQALTCRWLPLARDLFPFDWIFRRELAQALRILNDGGPDETLVDALEGVAFEEWEALVRHAHVEHPVLARRFLWFVAEFHPDEDWRYNAIRHLVEADELDEDIRQRLLGAEANHDVCALLSSDIS